MSMSGLNRPNRYKEHYGHVKNNRMIGSFWFNLEINLIYLQ
jgi:hypothetical protein